MSGYGQIGNIGVLLDILPSSNHVCCILRTAPFMSTSHLRYGSPPCVYFASLPCVPSNVYLPPYLTLPCVSSLHVYIYIYIYFFCVLRRGINGVRAMVSHRKKPKPERNEYVIVWGWWSSYWRRTPYKCISANKQNLGMLYLSSSVDRYQATMSSAYLPAPRLGFHPITMHCPPRVNLLSLYLPSVYSSLNIYLYLFCICIFPLTRGSYSHSYFPA